MAAVLSGSNLGARSVVLDINDTTSPLTLKDATKNEFAKIVAIEVHGTTGGGDGTLTLRNDSATGLIAWHFAPANSTRYDVIVPFDGPTAPRIGKGLYLIQGATAWVAGATLTIHYA